MNDLATDLEDEALHHGRAAGEDLGDLRRHPAEAGAELVQGRGRVGGGDAVHELGVDEHDLALLADVVARRAHRQLTWKERGGCIWGLSEKRRYDFRYLAGFENLKL